MNFERPTPKKEILSDRFLKYGITTSDDGSFYGPKKPEYSGQTPEYKFENGDQNILESEKAFLLEYFVVGFSTVEHQDSVMKIVDKIFHSITDRSYKDFSKVIIMSPEDFKDFAKIIAPRLKNDRGIVGDFHGIHLGGLIIIQDTGLNNCFPLIFHELGHSLYPDEHENYLDELRAMYFQILCTKKLEKELEKIGITGSYPDDQYKDISMPSEDHRKAFNDARALFMSQINYDVYVKDNYDLEKVQQELLKKVKQTTTSFQ